MQGSWLITPVGLGFDLWPVIIDRVSNPSVKKKIMTNSRTQIPEKMNEQNVIKTNSIMSENVGFTVNKDCEQTEGTENDLSCKVL